MLVLLAVSLLGCQDPAETPPKIVPVVVEAGFEAWDDRTARAAIAEFKTRMKGRDVALRDRLGAVDDLARGSNKQLVRPLQQLVLRDSALTVRKAAAVALGNQPARQARPALLKLIKHDDVEDVPQLRAVLVASLSRAGYERRDWREIDNLFDREFGADFVPLQRAILALVVEHVEIEAIDVLVRNLDEPYPTDIDGASNPPAEYWERRWKAWAVWRDDVKNALLVLTGQRFSTAKEAKVWLRKNRKKLERRR